MQLTEEQAQSVRTEPEAPHEMIDPATNRRYVLIAAEIFTDLLEDAADARNAAAWSKATQHGMALAFESN